jgi:hypothetical protein
MLAAAWCLGSQLSCRQSWQETEHDGPDGLDNGDSLRRPADGVSGVWRCLNKGQHALPTFDNQLKETDGDDVYLQHLELNRDKLSSNCVAMRLRTPGLRRRAACANGFVTMFFLLVPGLSSLVSLPLSRWISDLRFVAGPMFFAGPAVIAGSLFIFSMKSWGRVISPTTAEPRHAATAVSAPPAS